jgi:hypothetical protein
MMRSKIIWASIALATLTLGGLVSLYQVLFDVWMTAYPFANANEWRTRLYIRLATTIVIALFWSVLAAWLYRQRRQAGGAR